MANLPESSTFDEGIYQIEVSDPVIGGPSGISNFQAKALANRTRYLKTERDTLRADVDGVVSNLTTVQSTLPFLAPLESPSLTGAPTVPTAATSDVSAKIANTAFVKAAIAALIDSSPAALDTLNELAAALGDDPNFATTITNALAVKAPLASPAFTGSPSGPTASIFANSIDLATTAFVQRALGNMRGGAVINASATLDSSHIGKTVQLSGAGSYTVTLPIVSDYPEGSVIELVSSTSNITVAGNGSDLIHTNMSTGVASITLGPSESAVFKKLNGVWGLLGGSKAAFASSFPTAFNNNGYIKMPNGLIFQWGTVAFTSSAVPNFNIAFPSAALWVGASQGFSFSQIALSAYVNNNSSFIIGIASGVSISANWFAIGH